MPRKSALMILTAIIACLVPLAPGAGGSPPAAREWKDARQISPQELAGKLRARAGAAPVVLQVGFKALYDGGHIPGAIFAGPAGTPRGLAELRSVAEKIPRSREVVLYCGCCPWEKCPNIRPAWEALARMHFRHLVVLVIPQDFAHDWVGQGLPLARSR